MQQGCTHGQSPAVPRATTLVEQTRSGPAGQELPEPRAGGWAGAHSLVMGGPASHSPWHRCAPGLVERDLWPCGDPGGSGKGQGCGRMELPQRRGLAEPAVSGQHCSPDPRSPGWGSRVKPCWSPRQSLILILILILFQPSKQSQPGMWDTKAGFTPRIQPSSCLVLWQHLWALHGPPWAPPGAEAQDKHPNMSCTCIGTGAKLSPSLLGGSSLLQ